MISCHCQATDQHFDAKIAQRELRRFRRRGPSAPTQRLLAAVEASSLPSQASLLDVGGGIGAIHHVLLERRFSRAQHVDASAAYLEVAASEAERLGHGSRVDFLHADFAAVGDSVPQADLVTLDRVVCCDQDYDRLLTKAAHRARRALALSYPRPRRLTRLVIALANTVRRLVGNSYRAYVHPPAAMVAVLERAGLQRHWAGGTWIWAVDLFERATRETAASQDPA